MSNQSISSNNKQRYYQQHPSAIMEEDEPDDDPPPPAGLPVPPPRVWTETELAHEFGTALDQPRDAVLDDVDDEFYEPDESALPFRFLTDWTLLSSRGGGDLPLEGEFASSGTAVVVRGTLLLPPPRGAENDNDGTQPQQQPPPTVAAAVVVVELQPTHYCLDRSPACRGYWLVTGAAYYWLHEPAASSDPHRHLSARAVLTAVSDVLHRAFGPHIDDSSARRWAQMPARAAAKECRFDAKLLFAADAAAVLAHLRGAHPALTPRCAFLRSIAAEAAGRTKKRKLLPPADLLARCRAVERRLPQTAWGQPRELAAEEEEQEELDALSTDDDDGESKESAAEETAPRAKRATKRSRSRTAASRGKRARGKSAPRKRREQSGDDDEEMPTAVSTSPSSLEEENTTAVAGARGRARRAAAAKKVNYADGDSADDGFDDDDDDSSVDQRARRQPRAKRAASSTLGKRARAKKADSDDEEAELDELSESDYVSDVEDELSESSSEEEEEEEEAPKARRRGGRKPAATKAASSKKSSAAPAKKEKIKMCDMFQPMNAPSYKTLSLDTIHEEKEFLDPCGMEATDEIIDRLVGDQVDKIGSLLQRSLANFNVGSAQFPLRLGTACSGTDAPALALTLVSEQMEHRGLGDLFRHTHEFSCENDPFKQAYLARNFDSILYPDIAKLCDEPPRDVYGREQAIPPFNLFVAGTSCKNFSMLRTKRLDIEDKGCSGETFIAAIELLFKEQPKMAIFENVIGAPWAKMQEYITGRVKLSECDSNKAIKDIKDKNAQLTFILDKHEKIVADRVPSVYGVRCGAVVAGFLRPKSSKLNKIEWPSKSKDRCTLAELMKANNILKKDDTLVFETDCAYCTRILKVDTKDFGLPQTRLRTYMFVWQIENDDTLDDLGDYWIHLVKHLQSPVRHSLQSFILQVDHDIIRVFREALRGPPGRHSMRSTSLEPYFWESANANLPHNKVAREKLGLDDMARFTTRWHANGEKQIPPHYWLEYMKCCSQRQMDLIDILAASSMRDAIAHDSNFASYYWNISQNASKEKHRSAVCGIAGCITPGGDFLLPQEGRPILGCEKLMLQGIPYFRLALGNETEVQLGDLAGNAMSLPVVCATMLAAITCGQLRQEMMQSPSQDIQLILENASLPTRRTLCQWDAKENAESAVLPEIAESADALSFLQELAKLAEDAVKSSIWCTCESSGSDSSTDRFLQCKHCRCSVCRNCVSATAGYNLDGHATEEVYILPDSHNNGKFRSRLLSVAANKAFVFNKEGIQEIASLGDGKDTHRVSGLSNYKFCFHDIKRSTNSKKWIIVYYAREGFVDEPVAEFRISIGELKRENLMEGKGVEIGVKGELISFLPAKTAPIVYGILDSCATVTVDQDSQDVFWEGKGPDSVASLIVKGEGSEESPRVEMGLSDAAADSLVEATRGNTNRKHFQSAVERGEKRRWTYPVNWKDWPNKITIQRDPSVILDEKLEHDAKFILGTYQRAGCRQTTNQSALWIRDGLPTMYILIRPNKNRTGPDTVIVSSSISHNDTLCIRAIFPRFWDPCDALDSSNEYKVENVQLTSKIALKAMKCRLPSCTIEVDISVDEQNSCRTKFDIKGLGDDDLAMLLRRSDPKLSGLVKLNVDKGQIAQQNIRIWNILCAAPFLQFMSSGKLASSLKPDAPWLPLTAPVSSPPFGCCSKTNPKRPTEEWYFDEERGAWDRRSQPGASRKYFQELQDAPKPFEFWVDRKARTLSVKIFPEVTGHHSAYQLIEGRGGPELHKQVKVSYRLSDVSQQSDPNIEAFKVSNCDDEDPTFVPLKGPFKLYERQQKVVSKMLAIENMKTDFEELELSEHAMPGAAGLSLVSRATRTRKISGAVIADAIGAGKTVVSISIILKGLEEARRVKDDPQRRPNRTGATLVVVPPALIDQWESELEKFTEGLTVLKLYGNKELSKISLKDIIEADVVICPIDILESSGYMERLLKASGDKAKDVPTLPPYAGQMEQSGAQGVWIPATSADPYGGANNGNNQKRRNQSAFFTHVYHTAIQTIRRKEFGPKDHVPLEYFEWQRIFVDEIHESLCTTKAEMSVALQKEKSTNGTFKEKNRRAGRELLGITQKDTSKRPLIYHKGLFGLTGTPLLDSAQRVIELANLMDNVYVCGLWGHWRKLERESLRDIFLHNYLEPKQSREVRKNISIKCQDYLRVACCRNKTGEEMEGIQLMERLCVVNMTYEEAILYTSSQSGIAKEKQSFAIQPEEFDVSAGHKIHTFLQQNASLESRGRELVRICKEILSRKGDERTKIVVFTDGIIGAGIAARKCLDESGLGCTFLEANDSVETKNKKIAWYQSGDATEEDRNRSRVLVLHFDHSAGLNLQTECHDLILFTPLYVGEGGTTSDAVADASTEQQAIGRVYRQGQPHPCVNVWRIEVRGNNGEHCLDRQLIRRNTDEQTISMAVNAGD